MNLRSRFKRDNSLAVSPIRPLWHASLNHSEVTGTHSVPEPVPEPPSAKRTQPHLCWPNDRPPPPPDGRSTGLYAGQDGARRDQAGQQRDRVRPAAQRAGSHRESHRHAQPVPRQRLRRTPGAPGQTRQFRPGAHRRGLRIGQPVPAVDPDQRFDRRRGDVRLARVRGVPAAGPRRRRHPGAGAADRPHPRPRRDAGRRHRPHPADLRVQPEQPDVDGGAARRVGPVRRGGAERRPGRASTRPTSSTSATACCPTASVWSATTPM